MRHDFAAATAASLAEAILHRDTPGGVGTAKSKRPPELKRENVQDAVIAAGKEIGRSAAGD